MREIPVYTEADAAHGVSLPSALQVAAALESLQSVAPQQGQQALQQKLLAQQTQPQVGLQMGPPTGAVDARAMNAIEAQPQDVHAAPTQTPMQTQGQYAHGGGGGAGGSPMVQMNAAKPQMVRTGLSCPALL